MPIAAAVVVVTYSLFDANKNIKHNDVNKKKTTRKKRVIYIKTDDVDFFLLISNEEKIYL
jgi:hypothetical protein